MKSNKILAIAVLILSLLAFSVSSQSKNYKLARAIDKISLEEQEECRTAYYEDMEDIYGYVTRTNNTYGTCYNPQNQSNYGCIIGSEQYQSYEVTGQKPALKNKTECYKSNSYKIRINKLFKDKEFELDSSRWGACAHDVENGCIAITCVSLHDGAFNGQFTDCTGGKSCQKFVFCENEAKVFYKNSREDFVQDDPTFYLEKLSFMEAPQ